MSGTWQATWQCGGKRSRHECSTREEALRWGAEQPAGVYLFLDPETNNWEGFIPHAVLAGHYAIDPENWF